jgi:hypothetical protein
MATNLKRTLQWMALAVTGSLLFAATVVSVSRDVDLGGHAWVSIARGACRLDVTIATPIGTVHLTK